MADLKVKETLLGINNEKPSASSASSAEAAPERDLEKEIEEAGLFNAEKTREIEAAFELAKTAVKTWGAFKTSADFDAYIKVISDEINLEKTGKTTFGLARLPYKANEAIIKLQLTLLGEKIEGKVTLIKRSSKSFKDAMDGFKDSITAHQYPEMSDESKSVLEERDHLLKMIETIKRDLDAEEERCIADVRKVLETQRGETAK